MASRTQQSRRAYGQEFVVRKVNEDSVRVDAPDGTTESFESLSQATDHAFARTRNVRVAPGVYTYTESLYLPPESRLHFEDVRLQPDGCHGIRVGDGTEQTDQFLTGKVAVDPDEGESPATTCLLVDGAKRLQVDGAISLGEGARDAAMAVYGGDEGCWWNSYRGLYVYGRYHQAAPGDGVPNAQNFLHCLFRGSFTVDAGNSLVCRDCWWEGSSDDHKHIWLRGGSALLHSRFESFHIEIETDDSVAVVATHESNFTIDESVENPSVSLTRGDFTRLQSISEANETAAEFYQHATYTDPESAVLQLHQTDGDEGEGHLLRAVSARPEGYYLRGESDRGLDKSIEVNGDYLNEANGRGLVVRTPDGESQYRIRIDNDGELLTEEV